MSGEVYNSDLDLCSHQFRKLAYDGSVSGPGGGGDQIAVNNGLVGGDVHIFSAGKSDVRSDGGICGGFVAFQYAGGSQDLRAVADGCDGFAGRKEFFYDLQNTGVQADIFRGTSAGNEESFIILRLYSVKICRKSEIVSAQFRVGLLAQKIVNGSGNRFSGFLVRADGVYLVAENAERLERYHSLIILRKIPTEQQYFFCHRNDPPFLCVLVIFIIATDTGKVNSKNRNIKGVIMTGVCGKVGEDEKYAGGVMEQKSRHFCPNCGAPVDKTMPKCPYCGHIYEEGAERQFMQELEMTRQKLDRVDDVARAGYRQEWRTNTRSAARKIVLALAVIGAVAGMFVYSENRLFRDDRKDYAQEMAWQHEHFPELTELYEAGKYDEALDLFFTYSEEEHDMWDWKYYDELMDYAEQAEMADAAEPEDKTES